MKSTEPVTDLMAALREAVNTARRDRRVSELYRMPKSRLVPLWRQTHPNTSPPERWSKDELVSEILEAEFPPAGA